MKTLGLVGGTSWVSTLEYYKLINIGINEKLGGLNYAQCIIYSFNYADIVRNNESNDWDSTLKMVSEVCKNLKMSGAGGIVLCANTLHKIADEIENEINLPVINIATATADEIRKKKSRLGYWEPSSLWNSTSLNPN